MRPNRENPEETAAALMKVVCDLADELHPGQLAARQVSLDSSLDRDLGLDSLARMELLTRIEGCFGVALSEQIFTEAETPRDLLRAVLSASAFREVDLHEKVQVVEAEEAVAAPASVQTLTEVLDWHLKAHPERSHIRFYVDEGEGEVISYRRLKDGAEKVARGLQQLGLLPGEPVAIMLPTGVEYFFSFFGVIMAGGVPVAIYPPARKALLEDHLRRQLSILGNCRAVTLITMTEAGKFARLLKSQLASLKNLVTVDELSSLEGEYNRPTLGASDTVFLQYTSGSTGDPKGVVLSHANLLANIRAMGKAVQVDDTDVIVSWLPLYHDMGLIGTWLSSLYYAVPLVILSPFDFLSRPKRWLWAIHRYGGTLSPAPNFAYEICLTRLKDEDLAGLDLSSWRCAFNGAEPVSPTTVERFCERFAPYGFRHEAMMPVYGMAECTVGLAFPPFGRGPLIDRVSREEFMRSARARPAADDDRNALRFVACGRPLDGHEIRIVDFSGRELSERNEGRVQFRGPSATSGYFRNPDKTAHLFDGAWLDSGDLGYIAGGDIYITGRIKDVIIVAGRNIYPQELEEAVGNLEGIRKGNVVVFGSKDSVSGTERLIVLAETRETDRGILERLRTDINSLTVDILGNPPDDLILAPPKTILKTSSGKIRRAASRELYERGRAGKKEAPWRQSLRFALFVLGSQWRRVRQRAASVFNAGYLWFLFWLLAPPVWIAVALLPCERLRWAVMRGALSVLCRTSCTPLSVYGLENFPRGRPCVVVSNHASYLDGLVLVAALPPGFSFVAKAELQEGFISRLFLTRIKSEFVERFDKQKGIEDARRISGRLEEGRPLVFFPEGTFTRIPGLRPFFMGAFIAAAESRAPVVPVAIRGTRSILRERSKLPRRGSITVHIGEPLCIEEADIETSSWGSALKLREGSRKYILQYCGEPDLGQEKQ